MLYYIGVCVHKTIDLYIIAYHKQIPIPNNNNVTSKLCCHARQTMKTKFVKPKLINIDDKSDLKKDKNDRKEQQNPENMVQLHKELKK